MKSERTFSFSRFNRSRVFFRRRFASALVTTVCPPFVAVTAGTVDVPVVDVVQEADEDEDVAEDEDGEGALLRRNDVMTTAAWESKYAWSTPRLPRAAGETYEGRPLIDAASWEKITQTTTDVQHKHKVSS